MIAGRYSLDREIGRGGMGAVWLGRDEVLGRPVAIKRIGLAPGDATPDLLRAEREAKIAASLNHPHIVSIYDLVTEDDHQWLVMEYVEGTTLAELIRTAGPLHPDQVTPILAQAASALAAAHASSIVHRDVKPSNILVREDGQVKLGDFGIARSVDDASITQTGLVTGSPAYLAPEIASGQQATAASDVWSLGATLFHCLAGHAPYEVTENVLGALYRIVHEAPPRLDGAGELAPLLAATMAHDPSERWKMGEVVAYLDRTSPMQGRLPTPLPTPSAPSAPSAPSDRTRALGVEDAAPIRAPDPAHAARAMPAPEALAGGTETKRVAPVVPAPAPAPAPAAAVLQRRRRSGVLPSLIGLLVVALVIAIAVLALQDDPQPALENAGNDPGSAAATDPGAGQPDSHSPSAPSETESTPPTEAELRAFIENYLQTASTDPASGFKELTNRYQRASTRYANFWGRVTNPQILAFSADPEALTVTYDYRYQLDGRPKRQTVTLQLVSRGSRLLISDQIGG